MVFGPDPGLCCKGGVFLPVAESRLGMFSESVSGAGSLPTLPSKQLGWTWVSHKFGYK